MVVSLLMTLRKQPPGAPGKLMRAGATSAERALKPKTAGILRHHELEPALRSGLVFELEDGRYWVDVPRLKRRRLRLALIVFCATGAVVAGAWFALRAMGLLP
jgi:hypothetical protein